VIVKGPPHLEAPRPAISRAEVREALIELWAHVFEAELRAHLAENAADDRHQAGHDLQQGDR
jgi:hypothetical protein